MKSIGIKQQRLIKTLALGASFGMTTMMAGVAEAQPNVGGGQGQNPPNQNPGGNQGGRGDFRERILRGMLERSGVNTQAQQDAVLAFAREQETATQSLRVMAEKLVTAVSTLGVPDTEVARLLKDLQDAVAKEKERRKTARADLDKKINYSKQPRLEMGLTMMGLIGDDSLSMGNLGGRMFGFGGGFGGPGGFGGGPGGGFGGPGGPGGGAGQANGGRQN